MDGRQKWQDLAPGKRRAIIVAGVLQLLLQLAALHDLSRRTPLEVNGPKKAWVAASFINFAGPIAYFVRGRKK
ncbi:hypothetical protein QO003_001613 [Arthrobacter silviterrae]|uniref:PLDc_N domain-containing protein n=1 Tax=Arthrobacter silviterrae TaxID=2026658 RepID=A0ABX0D8G2_9MICC|nr:MULTISPECIES: hypothetical protein [Arthrobacter]MCU6479338.1 hypothetical protein [Arthrobacter sp. A2-55]MDQ0277310.1 hypothetical protein [Arthrobacter silviterrae]NGN82921.1 hypothetical protein [Arthrobacter silviterrae]